MPERSKLCGDAATPIKMVYLLSSAALALALSWPSHAAEIVGRVVGVARVTVKGY